MLLALLRVSSKFPRRTLRAFTSFNDEQEVIEINTPFLYPTLPKFNLEPDSLLSLVQEKRFGAADRVLNQLIDSRNVHKITPHPDYEFAAIAALNWGNPAQAEKQFKLWFHLVPHIRHPNARLITSPKTTGVFFNTPFQRTISALMQSGNPSSNIPIITQFALICALKGYINHVYNWVVTPLARYNLSAAEFSQFLDDIEEAAIKYEAPNHPTADSCKLASQLRESAVELLCRLDRYKHAQSILIRNAEDEHVILPDRVYAHFIESFKRVLPKKQGRIEFIQQLQKAENAKREKLEYLPRLQVRIKSADAATHPPPQSTHSAEFPESASFRASLNHLGDRMIHLSSTTKLLDVCRSRLDRVEQMIRTGQPLGQTKIAGLYYAIQFLEPRIPSRHRYRDLYLDIVYDYGRLRAMALSRPPHTAIWINAEIFVHDLQHHPTPIFSGVFTYYSFEDVPAAYYEALSDYTINKPWREDVVPEEEDRLVLEPRSREAAVLLKWLVIEAGRRPHSCQHLSRLWLAFRGVAQGVAADTGWSEQYFFKRTMLEVMAAFIWSFSKKEQYDAWLADASRMDCKNSKNVVSTTTIRCLRDIWESWRAKSGRYPSWREFLLSVQSESHQDKLAETYFCTIQDQETQ